MLTKSELLTLIDHLGLPQWGSTLLLDAHQKAPVREVVSCCGNVITLAPSKKAPCIVATESRSIDSSPPSAMSMTSKFSRITPSPASMHLRTRRLIERIKALDHTASTRVRHGKRRAYHEGDFVHVLSYDTPVHGSRPFQYCHIDHTQLDIELVCSRTGINLGRPWFSLAIDSFTRRILGIYLTYDPPSYHSNMMVLRDIVRRHQRLPQFIVTDNGKDFQSVNFETFLMAMEVYLRFRPSGRPWHGAVLERLFGRARTEYVHNLAGNTKATKNVRMTTGKYLPARLTSIVYFAVSPLTAMQSELLARTSPTIWDVLIASFGGLAGIVAMTRKERTTVIPGVAIATALMPPLCTAGYGIAAGSWHSFLGAFYLFTINCVFIATSSAIVVKAFKMPQKRFVDEYTAVRMHRYQPTPL